MLSKHGLVDELVGLAECARALVAPVLAVGAVQAGVRVHDLPVGVVQALSDAVITLRLTIPDIVENFFTLPHFMLPYGGLGSISY